MVKPFRYLVKQNDKNSNVHDLYKVYGSDAEGSYCGSITDKETLHLILQAPAMVQLHANIKKLHPEIALTTRSYTTRTLKDFSSAFVSFLRKLS